MNWKTVRLELCKTEGFPNGSVSRAYHLHVPLNAAGEIDGESFDAAPAQVVVRRFWGNEADRRGKVVRVNGRWGLRCNGDSAEDVLLLEDGPLKIGGSVGIAGPDGALLYFRVASIEPLRRAA